MKIIVVGCGRMGAALAAMLNAQGHAVTVVDTDPLAFERLGAGFEGGQVVGVGFDRDVLLQAGIERADALAAVTGNDEANVVVARLARELFRVPRVVARVYDPRKAEIYRRLGVQTVSTTTWGVQRIAELLCYSHLETLVTLGSGEVELVETVVPPLLVDRSMAAVTIPGEVHLVAISRRGRTFLPSPGAIFQDGDVLHLAVLAASSDRLRALLAPG